MSSEKIKSIPGAIRRSRSNSMPRSNTTPYSKETSSQPTDINDLRIQAIENRILSRNAAQPTTNQLLSSLKRDLTAEEMTFKSLLEQLNQQLKQAEFNIMNDEFIYKEHYIELRRQIQLAKETKIAKIEEMATQLIDKVNKFEKESFEDVLKVDKNEFITKINELKKENQKWNQCLDDYKVDSKLLDELRNSVSTMTFRTDTLNSELLKKLMKFSENSDEITLGEVSVVSLDSINKINLEKHFNDLLEKYLVENYSRFYGDRHNNCYQKRYLDVDYRIKTSTF